MVIWPVRGEGLLVRVLARECLLYDPGSYELNARALVDGRPVKTDAEFVADSDDFFAVSLAPLGKDIDWCLQRQKIEYMWLSRWWLHYDSALNDLVASTKIRVHYVECTSKWRQKELASDLFVRRGAMYREGLRTWRALHELRCERAAELLAMAMHTGAIARVTALSGRMLIFAPSDEGFDLIPEQMFEDILGGRSSHSLEQLIRAHIVVMRDEEPDLEERLQAGPVELTAADGRKLRLRASRRPARDKLSAVVVNEGVATSEYVRAGRNLVFRLEGTLFPLAMPIRQEQPGDAGDAAANSSGAAKLETR
jgi:Fasciclin domain